MSSKENFYTFQLLSWSLQSKTSDEKECHLPFLKPVSKMLHVVVFRYEMES